MTNIVLTALLSTFSRFKYFPLFTANLDLSFYELNYDVSLLFSFFPQSPSRVLFFTLGVFIAVIMSFCSVPTSQGFRHMFSGLN